MPDLVFMVLDLAGGIKRFRRPCGFRRVWLLSWIPSSGFSLPPVPLYKQLSSPTISGLKLVMSFLNARSSQVGLLGAPF